MDSDQAVKLFAEGRHREIAETWESQSSSATGDQPTEPRFAQVAAASYLVIGEAQRSVAICQSILPFLSEDPSFLALYGSALRTSGSTSDAHTVLESANKKYPTDPIIGNNYANLLIDLGLFDQSIDLLKSFISQNPPPPNLSDLKTNYDRAAQARALKASSPQTKTDNILTVCDPLERAFLLDETRPVSPPDDIKNLGEIIPDPLQGTTMSEHITYLRKLVSSDPKVALEELSRSISTVGPRSVFYQIAGESYIALKSFDLAERSFLYSLIFSNEAPVSVLINLTSLTAMRADLLSARSWLEKIRHACNDHPSLTGLEKMIHDKSSIAEPCPFPQPA